MLKNCTSKYEQINKLIKMMINRVKKVQKKNQVNHSRRLQKVDNKNKWMIVHIY